MKCTDFKNLIDDYCENGLSDELKAGCDEHLSSCADCASYLAKQNQVLDSLKAMPIVGPSEGFTDRVIHVAMENNGANQGKDKKHHRHGFMMGFGSAAAAALALWVVVGVLPQQNSSDTGGVKPTEVAKANVANTNGEKAIPEFSIALNEQRDIKLAFYSTEELKGAQIKLQMPANVVVVGFPGQRELAWKTNLARGNNMLRLPVIATGADGGQLVAQIEYMGKVRTLKVNLAVDSPKVSGSADHVLRIV